MEVSGSHHFGTNWVPIDWAWLPENFRCGLAPRTPSQLCDLHQVTDQQPDSLGVGSLDGSWGCRLGWQ